MSSPSFDDSTGSNYRDQWSLDANISYLNHGSFGPPPRQVLSSRQEWLARLCANPMDFFVRQLGGHLREAREQLARLVGTSAGNIAFVENASTGMNVVADSVRLTPGDEVLTTDHDYGAVIRTWQRACDRAEAKLVVQSVPTPIGTAREIVEAVMEGVTSRTRLLVFSHVTSPTAIVFPAKELCRAARAQGVAVCIDGPHALAMRQIELDQLECDFYTASCHKWLSAPFGSGFLYVNPRWQDRLCPSVLSWGRALAGDSASWRDEFNWVGTRDPSAYLTIPDAIQFLEDIGWDLFRQRTHELARLARERITTMTRLAPLIPDSTDWYGSMIALPLPDPPASSQASLWTQPDALQSALWTHAGIEVPIVSWNDRRLIRVSCHLYTQVHEIDRLVETLEELLNREQNR